VYIVSYEGHARARTRTENKTPMKRYTLILLIAALFSSAACGVVWNAVFAHASQKLTVAVLDVGQGDSIYIESPTGTQVLIDSGANRAVLRQLPKVMPYFDTSLDMIMGTHPDGDHIGGFRELLDRYTTSRVVYQHVPHTAGPADAFEQALVKWRLKKEGANASELVVEPHRGDVWDIGGGAYITVLYPDRLGDSDDTNRGSMVVRVVFRDTAFMLTGDSPQEIEEYLVSLASNAESDLHSQVLKLGHHGSKTSSSPAFLAAVHPDVAIISRGCDNTYGHPHKEVLDTLLELKIPFLDTCTEGAIVYESDGVSVKRK
jgi:competence protein ComEC